MADTVTLTKLDAARRQLDVSIRMIFGGGDIVAAHTLVGAASNIISDLVKRRNPKRSWDHFAQEANDLTAKEYFRIMRRAQNFLKHAESDADGAMDFDLADTESLAFWAVMNLGELGYNLSIAESVMQLWYIASHSPVLDEASDANGAALKLFGDLRNVERAKRLSAGLAVLTEQERNGV